MALGGAFLTMSAFNAFFFEMINGRGWICIALVVFASWRPGKALLGALLFGAFDAFQLRLQTQIGGVVPYQIFLMMPYLLSIAALAADRAPRRLSEGADDPLPQGRALNSSDRHDLRPPRHERDPARRPHRRRYRRLGRPHRRDRAHGIDGRGRRGRSTPAAASSSPPFVDAHFHMDATLSLGLPRINVSGTLLEGIALWGELKPLLTQEAVIERALRYCDLAVAQGLLAIRTHVDVCDDRLLAVEALLEVKRARRALSRPAARRLPAGRLLPLAGRRRQSRPRARPGRRRRRRHPAFRAHDGRRRRLGAGPVRDRRRARPAASTCIATRPTIRCRATSRRWPPRRSASGLQGRVAGSHLTSMHSMDNYYVSKLMPLMARGGASRRSPTR